MASFQDFVVWLSDPNNSGMIIFILLLAVFLYFKRSNLKLEKIAFPFLYFIMYRTKLGLGFMDWAGKRHGKLIRFLAVIGIYVGFFGMVVIAITLIHNIYNIVTQPEAQSGVALVLPIKGPGIFHVPFFHWIITIFIIAAVHEFAHGVVARAYKMKVKSSGFAFLAILAPIIPAAFVEPDEKQLTKRPKKEQLAVFAAGPWANILLTFFVIFLFIFLLNPLTEKVVEPKGVEIISFSNNSAAKAAGLQANDIIVAIDGEDARDIKEFKRIMSSKSAGGKIKVYTEKESFDVVLGEDPENPGEGYLGVSLSPKIDFNKATYDRFGTFLPSAYMWLLQLLNFVALLSLGIGLFNLVPVGPIDGGRMLHAALLTKFDEKRANFIFNYVTIFFLGLIAFSVLIGFFR